VTAPGNLEGSELAAAAGVERLDLQHPGWTRDEAQALADAWALRARLNQVCGRAKCIGLPQLQPGDVAELAGVGARFNGRIWVSGVRHELDTVQGFRTHLQFGSLDADEALLQRLAQPRSPALVAQVAGLQCGVVTDLEDPTGEARVRVRLPLVDAEDDGLWARVATLDAGDGRGFQFRPELGDEVLLGFLGNDPRHPVILGMLHSSAKAPPLPLANDNPQKGYVSRSGMKLHFDDDKSILTLSTPSGHSLQLDDEAGALTLQDAHGNRIVLDSGGITLDSAGALQLNAGTEAHVEAQTSLSVKATLDLTLEGSASAELKGGTLAKVNAALVQIN
jgi:Rhs element Vgr protein